VLAGALRVHNADFTRAEAALRTDLAAAYLAADDPESATTLLHDAITIADTVGPFTGRIGFADSIYRKRAAEHVLYHRVLGS
jgi:Tfp pilus assembly protein PilF